MVHITALAFFRPRPQASQERLEGATLQLWQGALPMRSISTLPGSYRDTFLFKQATRSGSRGPGVS